MSALQEALDNKFPKLYVPGVLPGMGLPVLNRGYCTDYKSWTWTVPRGATWYSLYTTAKARHEGKIGYWAVRVKVTHRHYGMKDYKLVQSVCLQSRWRAKDQAYKWYCKGTGTEFQSFHKKRKPTEAQLKRFAEYKKEQSHDD